MCEIFYKIYNVEENYIYIYVLQYIEHLHNYLLNN